MVDQGVLAYNYAPVMFRPGGYTSRGSGLHQPVQRRQQRVNAPATIDQEELNLFRDMLRRYLEAEIEPHYARWEREQIFRAVCGRGWARTASCV